jgi:hypothetical protein
MAGKPTTVTATFDGEVLRPDVPLDLEPNASYVVTIQPNIESSKASNDSALDMPRQISAIQSLIEDEVKNATSDTAWDVLERLQGSVNGPTDWSVEHDHYLYGSPKRFSKASARYTYKRYHVIPDRRGGWRVEGEKSKRASSWHDTKEQAVERGRGLAKARNGQLIVHTMDGAIEIEYTYGHDPASRPG